MNLPTPSTPVLAAALAYIELGFAVVPVYGVSGDDGCGCGNAKCGAPGKHPVGHEWQKRAARDVDAVREAFTDHAGNIGLYLGGSGYVVLDFDGEAGLRIRDSLLEAGILPDTLTARSGSGGEHRVYRFAEWQDSETVSDRRVGVGWDVKRSGQFLVAPSVHACGGAYEWISDADIAELPEALYERIRKTPARAPSSTPPPPPGSVRDDMIKRARAYVATMPAAISGAGGHDATFNVARRLVQDFRLSEEAAWALLVEYNARCEPPWSERELKHKLDSAAKARVSNPIEDRPRPRTVGNAAVDVDAPTAAPSSGPSVTPNSNVDWRVRFLWETNKTGKRKLPSHVENVIIALTNHEMWTGVLRYDEFRGQIVKARPPPWLGHHRPKTEESRWVDEDTTRMVAWMRREFHAYSFSPTATDCDKAIDVVSRSHAFNPVREYLESLTWDGTFRINAGPKTYFDSPTQGDYASNVFRWWLVSAVARVFEPGCKADHVLILEGDQGLGKSTALEILASPAWFTDSAIDLNSKDAFERVRGRWIVELAELNSLFGAEASKAKQFFSSKRDDYRPAYGRREREQLRQCVFAGTVNLDVYLNDPTGARRFWPLVCLAVRHELIKRDRDQLWAEAVWWYREGAPWWPNAAAYASLAEEQSGRTKRDEWTDVLAKWLRTAGDEVSTGELLSGALQLEKKDWSHAAQTRIGLAMKQLAGWVKRRRRTEAGLTWCYVRRGSRADLHSLPSLRSDL